MNLRHLSMDRGTQIVPHGTTNSLRPIMPRTLLYVALGLLACIAYLAPSMLSGFIPHDEGTLAQSAERVLAGETPHIDFDDVYTGGLSYLHAATFHLLGARSSSLRVVLLLFSIAFVVAFYSAASRLVSPPLAVLFTFAAVAWSLKNYFAGLPSWYNLFFATFGTLGLMIDGERQARQQVSFAPLFLAGLMGGISILFKISGLFFVLAGLLYILYDAHLPTDGSTTGRPPHGRRPRLATACAWLAPPTTVLFLLGLMRQRIEPMDLLHFLLPATLVATAPWLLMHRRSTASWPLSDGLFVRRAGAFTSGVSLPLLFFLALYVLHHGLPAASALYRGILVLPQLRLQYAAYPLPPLHSLLPAAPLLLLFLPQVQGWFRGRWALATLVVALATLLALAASLPKIYQAVWSALRLLPLVSVVLALAHLWRRDPAHNNSQRLYLLAAVVAFTSLIQYPVAFGIYFFYVAPLILLLLVELSSRHKAGHRAQTCLFGFFLLLAVLLLNHADIWRIGLFYERPGPQALLAPQRINLLAPENLVQGYEATAEIVASHTTDSEEIWVGPDLPEIYFLTHKRNPTRSFFDFFAPDAEAHLLQLTAGPRIRLLVINKRPRFSDPISQPSLDVLAERYPHARDLGPLVIRWRAAEGTQ